MSIFTERTLRSRILLAVLAFLILALIGGITYFVWQATAGRFTPIGDILQDVPAYDRQEVTIRGTARQVIPAPLLKATFALVEDKTGRIWCRLTHTLAEESEVLTIRGVVYKLVYIPVLDISVTAIAEQAP